jgi:hypothetical protein
MEWQWNYTRNGDPCLTRRADSLTQVITAGACWGYTLSTRCRTHIFQTDRCRNLAEALKTADNRFHVFAWDAFMPRPLPDPDDQARENRQYVRETREALAAEGRRSGVVFCPDGSMDVGNMKNETAARVALYKKHN